METARPIRVAIVEDDPALREALGALIAGTPGYHLTRRQETPMDPQDIDLIAAPSGDMERLERRQSLNRLLLSLPAEQREVVVLRIWHDLRFADIAALQGCSINTTISRYQYALKNLRRELGNDE